jgi:hypothetical protein
MECEYSYIFNVIDLGDVNYHFLNIKRNSIFLITLKLEAVRPVEILVTIYQYARHVMPKDGNVHHCYYEDLKSYIFIHFYKIWALNN